MKVFRYQQTTASTQWIVSHGLNSEFLAIDVFIDYSGKLIKTWPLTIEQTKGNETDELKINFNGSQTGRVVLISN